MQQNELPNLPAPWRSAAALAERINAGADTPTFTVHSIRHHIRNADRNGLAPHVRRIGRKVLVNEAGFIEWLNSRPAPESNEGGRANG